MLLRLISDERETGVLTEQMRAGWEACQPILDLGDEVGARMCFLDVYRRRIQDARQRGNPAHWSVTLGADPQLRIQRLSEAVAARRIDADQARWLLPGPPLASLAQVAGLLEGPDASPQELTTSQRLRDLAQMLRDLRVESDHRWVEHRQQQRESAAEQQRQALAAAEVELLKRGLLTCECPPISRPEFPSAGVSSPEIRLPRPGKPDRQEHLLQMPARSHYLHLHRPGRQPD